MSIDDMKIRSKIGKSVIELLEKVGCLKGMSQSNQMSLFSQNMTLESEKMNVNLEEIFTIKNIIIQKKSNLGTTDDGLAIIIKLENEELKYIFEGKNIIINKEQYEVKNLQQLKGYLSTI